MRKKLSLLTFIALLLFSINIVTASAAAKIIGQAEDLPAAVETPLFTEMIKQRMIWGSRPSYTWTWSDEKYQQWLDESYAFSFLRLKNGAEYRPLYCRNPGVSSHIQLYKMNYCLDEQLFTSNDVFSVAYDTGVEYILKNGYKYTPADNKDASLVSFENKKKYVEAQLALRAFEMLFTDKNSNNSNYTYIYNAHKNFVNNYILNDSSIVTKLQSLEDKLNANDTLSSKKDYIRTSKFSVTKYLKAHSDRYGSAYKDKEFTFGKIMNEPVWTSGTTKDYTSSVTSAAKTMFKGALDAAIASIGTKKADVKVSSPIVRMTTSGEDTNKTYTKTYTYTLTMENFADSGSYVKATFTNKKSAYVTGKLYVSTDGGTTKTEYVSNKNLLDYGSKNITLILEFSAKENDYVCVLLDFDIDIKYKDKSLGSTIYSVEECSGISLDQNYQKLYVLYDENNEKSKKIEDNGKDEFCPGEDICEDMETSCAKGYTLACNKLKEKWGGKCATCATNVTLPQCTLNDTHVYFKEGYGYTGDDVTNLKSCDAPENNVLSCVLNREDEAGNSYESNLIKNNNYCKVFCKEDYHIILPGQKETNSGRYFTLEASIEGAKTCYTTRIDKTKFESDIKIAGESLEKAYKTYLADNKSAVSTVSLSNASNNLNNMITEYNQCSNWTMTYNYAPKITFEYEEEYNAMLKTDGKNVFETKGAEVKDTSPVISYCSGDVNNDYSCKTTASDKKPTTKISVYKCDSSLNCGYKDVEILAASYIQQKMEVKGTYITPSEFYDVYPLGIVAYSKDGSQPDSSELLENQLPISLTTKTGVYNYAIKIADLGEFYNKDTDNLGRIWGASNSVTNAIIKEPNRDCITEGSGLAEKYGSDLTDGVYVCAYTVNLEIGEYQCEVIDGKYYDINGKEVTSAEYVISCNCHVDGENYYGLGGKKVTKEEYAIQCPGDKPICKQVGDDYYGSAGTLVTPEEYAEQCPKKIICQLVDGVYYGKDGNKLSSKTEFEKECPEECPDCPAECEPDGCEYEDCPSNNCPVVCEDCVYNDGKLNINVRPITNENLNPNKRPLGSNWESVKDPTIVLAPSDPLGNSVIETALELKASVTTAEIEKNGELIFDENKFDDDIVTVKLDGKALNWIREYNEKVELRNEGGYANNSLECFDHTTSDGKVYKNIYCYSTFIDELMDKADVDITTKRKKSGQRDGNKSQKSGYWTTWTEASVKPAWENVTTFSLGYSKTNYGKNINIGPSWK